MEHILLSDRSGKTIYLKLTDIVYLEAYGDGTYIYGKTFFDESFLAAKQITATTAIFNAFIDNRPKVYGDGTYIYGKTGIVYDTDKPLRYWKEQIGSEHFYQIHNEFSVVCKKDDHSVKPALAQSESRVYSVDPCHLDIQKNYIKFQRGV